MEVAFTGKEKIFKPLPDFIPVDFEDYESARKDEKEDDDLNQERVEKNLRWIATLAYKISKRC